jgi:hypothetical protein
VESASEGLGQCPDLVMICHCVAATSLPCAIHTPAPLAIIEQPSPPLRVRHEFAPPTRLSAPSISNAHSNPANFPVSAVVSCFFIVGIFDFSFSFEPLACAKLHHSPLACGL